MNTQSFGVERGTLIRVPATANLMVDSQDRDFASATDTAFNFQITRKQSLLNGFFSRIGATEAVINWCEPNISATLGNDELLIDISGVGANTHQGSHTLGIPNGSYTVSEVMDALTDGLNQITATTGVTATVVTNDGDPYIDLSGGLVLVASQPLADQLGLAVAEYDPILKPQCPDLRTYRYLDFICDNLTSVQDVKDNTTQKSFNRDVLLRWYFSEDVPEDRDAYGFPIRQGYLAFNRRRIFNPPKQIKWEQNLPVGNLRFQVYAPDGTLAVPQSIDTDWLMTLQLSEG